jgi:hypothetical protein
MKVTISKFQELYRISLMELSDLEKSSLFVQALTGYSLDKVDAMDIKSYEKLCNKVAKSFNAFSGKIEKGSPKKWVKANGRIYTIEYDINKMDSGKYVEMASFSQDMIGNLHKIIATMSTPIRFGIKGIVKVERDHEEIANDMLDLDFETGYKMSVFFCEVSKDSIKTLPSYLSNQEEMLVAVHLKDSSRHLDGYIMPNWLQNLKVSV